MSAKPKDLPIGIQTFENLIQGNYIYVDKTKHLYELVKGEQGVYFLSRPRRFGKSLLVSTLSSIFKGDKELFKNLWIYDSDYTWEKHPVIKLSMANSQVGETDTMETRIKIQLNYIAEEYGIELDLKPYVDIVFTDLIHKLHQKTGMKVVVLVDEYDGPIINHINDIPKANENRDLLRNFYKVLKDEDASLRFVFLTGVSKFAKTSIFSGLNNLKILTMDQKYSALLGYTQEELEYYFQDYIKDLCTERSLSQKQAIMKIKRWYNGYRFSEDKTKVYNPFSTMLMFSELKFKNYWFATGTPTFLINLIKKENPDIENFEKEVNISEFELDSYDLESIPVIPLMFDTGYLTIKEAKCRADMTSFSLTYPNNEVKIALIHNLLAGYSEENSANVSSFVIALSDMILENDLESFMSKLKSYFASIPYDIVPKRNLDEKYFQLIFYLLMRSTSFNVNIEDRTSDGRIDLVLEADDNIYLFEFKIDSSAEVALKQIKDKGYYEKYSNIPKKLFLIGINFDTKTRNISEYLVEEYN
ncbi:MAG: AAA family ATPase [Cyanobacteria bacterium REEB446]|nr:AAA family ATPase [Cyanobacteria bacterium REEB446]